MSTLDDFIEQAAGALELPKDSLPTELRTELLDLTRDVAHGVTRVAGPLSTYLIGVAVGRGADRATAIEAVGRIARSWTPEDADSTDPSRPTGPKDGDRR